MLNGTSSFAQISTLLLALFVGVVLPLTSYAQPVPGSCGFVGPNLVVNPEFDQGNVGITSSYAYNPGYVCDWGQYSVATGIVYDPAGACYGNPAFDIRTIWAATDRNDPTVGNFMIIDPCSPATGGAACIALDTNQIIWSQAVTICPSTQYTFSTYAKNLYFLDGPQYPGAEIEPQFELFVNGESLKDIHIDGISINDSTFAMPQTLSADSGVWRQISGTWLSPAGVSQASLEIRNTQTTTGGNDLAIDGIYFGMCGTDVSLNVAGVAPQCASDGNISPVLLSPSANTQASNWGYYQWMRDTVVLAEDPLLSPSDLIPDLITPVDPATGGYFGIYTLVVYPTTSPTTSCGQISETFAILDSCTGATSFPVEWLDFEVLATEQGAVLNWATASETQNRGFTIEHALEGGEFSPMAWVAGNGTTSEISRYSYEATSLAGGQHYFRLRQLDLDGGTSVSNTLGIYLEGPQANYLSVAPNPASGQSWITLSAPSDQAVQLSLHTLSGQALKVLYRGELSAQQQIEVPVDLSGLAAGVYMVRARGATFHNESMLMVR